MFMWKQESKGDTFAGLCGNRCRASPPPPPGGAGPGLPRLGGGTRNRGGGGVDPPGPRGFSEGKIGKGIIFGM